MRHGESPLFWSVGNLRSLLRSTLVKLDHSPVPIRWFSNGPLYNTHALCIYRTRNESTVLEWANDYVAGGGKLSLWALGDSTPRLRPWTVGSGPGSRCSLLNRLSGLVNTSDDILVVDDDVGFRKGSFSNFVHIARAAGLGLAQPAHSPRLSIYSFKFNRRVPISIARTTGIVEIGPMVFVDHIWKSHIFPMPDEGMGWGLEIEWSELASIGCVQGVVDAVEVVHKGRVGEDYHVEPEMTRVSDRLTRRGAETIDDLWVKGSVRRPWDIRLWLAIRRQHADALALGREISLD